MNHGIELRLRLIGNNPPNWSFTNMDKSMPYLQNVTVHDQGNDNRTPTRQGCLILIIININVSLRIDKRGTALCSNLSFKLTIPSNVCYTSQLFVFQKGMIYPPFLCGLHLQR